MANVLKTLFTDIAVAIRNKTGEPETVRYKPIDFPTKILGIEVGDGGGGNLEGIEVETIFEEQTITPTYSSSYDAYHYEAIALSRRVRCGDVFIVYIDGARYLCGATTYAFKFSTGTSLYRMASGNHTIVKKISGQDVTWNLSDTTGVPYCLFTAETVMTNYDVFFSDGATRKLRIDRIGRTVVS